MPFFPFLKPSVRRDALARQIQSAAGSDDGQLLAVLQGQWVHRYGIASLPAASPPLECSPEPAADLPSDSAQPPVQDEESTVFGEVEAALQEDRTPVPLSMHLRQEILSEDPTRPGDQSIKVVSAPPLNTPRSLRRWLPDVDESLPKAS